MTQETNGPDGEPLDAQPGAVPPKDRIEKLADDAVAAGEPIRQSRAGKKAVDVASDVFDKAEELGRKALDSDTGRAVSAKAGEIADKALDTDAGRKVAALADDLGRSEAGTTARKVWNTPLGRNVGTGAAAGAALGLVVPFFGPLFGAAIGGGLGYLRTLAKKN